MMFSAYNDDERSRYSAKPSEDIFDDLAIKRRRHHLERNQVVPPR